MMKRYWFHFAFFLAITGIAVPAVAQSAADYVRNVTIHRDEWGVPHIDGRRDADVVFGVAYAQCEDYFWQVEETYIQATGHFAEVVGEAGFDMDVQTAAFEIVRRSKQDFAGLSPKIRALCDAYAAGYNYYLEKNPEVTPRLITKFEPWYLLCYERYMMLQRLYGRSHAPRGQLTSLAREMEAAIGSNAWAISGKRTKSGNAMLFVNPHQPWYGTGMFTELHVRSEEGWNFSGSTFPGGPFPTMGHNEHLGWTHTVNEPDVADVYRVTFDHPDDPLKYRHGDGYKQASEWEDTIRVSTPEGLAERTVGFRKTHYGPIVAKTGENEFLAVRIARLHQGSRIVQALAMTKATNFQEWRDAMATLQLQMFNTVYADRDGNIFYVYNGAVPRRDPGFDWTKPVDGADPRTEWQGIHDFMDLPQVLNPISGFVQNCNSTPFTTTDTGNPSAKDFPSYMVEEKYDDKRRAKVSRYLLRNAHDITFDDWQNLAYDTTLYWPMTELPKYKRRLDVLRVTQPHLAAKVEPYLNHLLDWDYKSDYKSTQTTLCVEWYEQLYGRGYPVETLKEEYVFDMAKRFDALIQAAENLETTFGTWKVPYGDVHRLQRHPNQHDMGSVPFTDDLPSLPQIGVRGPLGVAFTVYHTPSTPERKLRYAVVGASFMGVYEFGDDVKAGTYLHYGQSGDPNFPHFFDQAQLLSERKFKPAWFNWDDVLAHTTRSYHPGEE